MDSNIREYLAEIGRRGGLKSRRKLEKKTARDMVRIREARRAFREFHSQCFWSFDPNYTIRLMDVAWVAKTLMKNGDRKAWDVGAKLCRGSF